MELETQNFFWWNLAAFLVRKKNFGRAGHPHAEISAKMLPTISIFAIFRPKIAENRYWLLWRDCSAPKWCQHLKKNFGRALKFFWCEKKFSAAPGTHMPNFRPKWPQNLPFFAQNRPFLDFFGAVEPQNELSTMKIFLGAENSIFYSRKIFRPRWAPTCRIFGQNLPFFAQNRPFWTFSGLWSPKMGSAPWKIFWWHKIVFFTRKKIFGHAGHPDAEISAKMTPKFGIFGQKQQTLESF